MYNTTQNQQRKTQDLKTTRQSTTAKVVGDVQFNTWPGNIIKTKQLTKKSNWINHDIRYHAIRVLRLSKRRRYDISTYPKITKPQIYYFLSTHNCWRSGRLLGVTSLALKREENPCSLSYFCKILHVSSLLFCFSSSTSKD